MGAAEEIVNGRVVDDEIAALAAVQENADLPKGWKINPEDRAIRDRAPDNGERGKASILV